MEQTTLSKSTQMAEGLAASVILNQFFKDLKESPTEGEQYQEALNHIAVVIMAAYPAAEA